MRKICKYIYFIEISFQIIWRLCGLCFQFYASYFDKPVLHVIPSFCKLGVRDIFKYNGSVFPRDHAHGDVTSIIHLKKTNALLILQNTKFQDPEQNLSTIFS
jgi:hypothetical protein